MTSATFSRVYAAQNILKNTPKIVFESTFVAIVVILLAFSPPERDVDLIEVFAIFGIAGIRLLPCGNFTIFANFTEIVFNLQAYKKAKLFLDDEDVVVDINVEARTSKRPRRIELKEIGFSYGDDENFVIKGLSGEFSNSRWNVILGPSGSGKSTATEIAAGLIPALSGKVVYYDNVGEIQGYVPSVAIVSQNNIFLDESIEFNVTFASASETDMPKLDRCLQIAKCDFVESTDYRIGIGGSNLSGGQLQRLSIARALYFDPDIYVFDEITSNLDADLAAAVVKSLEEATAGRIVLFVTHDKSLVSGKDWNEIYF